MNLTQESRDLVSKHWGASNMAEKIEELARNYAQDYDGSRGTREAMGAQRIKSTPPPETSSHASGEASGKPVGVSPIPDTDEALSLELLNAWRAHHRMGPVTDMREFDNNGAAWLAVARRARELSDAKVWDALGSISEPLETGDVDAWIPSVEDISEAFWGERSTAYAIDTPGCEAVRRLIARRAQSRSAPQARREDVIEECIRACLDKADEVRNAWPQRAIGAASCVDALRALKQSVQPTPERSTAREWPPIGRDETAATAWLRYCIKFVGDHYDGGRGDAQMLYVSTQAQQELDAMLVALTSVGPPPHGERSEHVPVAPKDSALSRGLSSPASEVAGTNPAGDAITYRSAMGVTPTFEEQAPDGLDAAVRTYIGRCANGHDEEAFNDLVEAWHGSRAPASSSVGEERVREIVVETVINAHARIEERLYALDARVQSLERGRVRAPGGKIPEHCIEPTPPEPKDAKCAGCGHAAHVAGGCPANDPFLEMLDCSCGVDLAAAVAGREAKSFAGIRLVPDPAMPPDAIKLVPASPASEGVPSWVPSALEIIKAAGLRGKWSAKDWEAARLLIAQRAKDGQRG